MKTDTKKNRRSGFRIMGRLIGLVKPLAGIMVLAITLGVIGYLCAIFLTILAGYCILNGMMEASPMMASKGILIGLVVIAISRGLLHYGEQYCNHFIAFRLLAIIRHHIFDKLRKLCPAKLEGRDKGNLISIITSDIELLEVSYAHTISPIAIGIITSVVMVIFIGSFSFSSIVAIVAYLVVGGLIPIVMGRKGSKDGLEYRNGFGDLNSFVLESLHGLDETIRYGGGIRRMESILDQSVALGRQQQKLGHLEATQRAVTNLTVLFFSFLMLFVMIWQFRQGMVDFKSLLLATMSMMGSFGPVIALSNLSNNLNQTLASGERVLTLLEEMPQVEEVQGGKEVAFTGATADHVDFAYGSEPILTDYTIEISKGSMVGIHGASGSGKSTLLKLMMRFWDTGKGNIRISGTDIRSLNTGNLREMESYVTQETWLFHDTIAANIAIGNPSATREEIQRAAKMASIDQFITKLPQGYDTMVGELGDTLSGGERQRIGIARAFLHDAPFLLLDEPTSNLDSLNEAIIIKSLKESKGDRTVVLVSHRQSTLQTADTIIQMQKGRVS